MLRATRPLLAVSFSLLQPLAATNSLAVVVGGAGASLAAATALAQQEVGSRGELTAQQLMQALLPYGVWSTHPEFGWVWQPHDVQPWWQPFAVGEWIVTQDGSPYWRSGYPYGWATEHYGSWTYDERKGWLWVPGNDWSAAPVSWRSVDGVIGWAPMLATSANTQSVACPQPAFAWIFVSTDRLMTTSNFAAAEKDLLARDTHGTWGEWAHSADGPAAHRVPEPRNANLLDSTRCLGAAEANDAFRAVVRARGNSTQGPPIDFVTRRSEMGSGRVTGGELPVYAPVITGDAPPAGGTFLVNPPAERVQRAQPVARAQPVERAEPAQRAQPAQRVDRAQPVAPVLPTEPVVPASPMTPYEAYTYQHAQLNRYHAEQYDALRRLQASDATTPPYPGFDPSKLPAWKQRELLEMQRMAARQRKLLDERQSDHAGKATEPETVPTTPPTSGK
jgi:hypothetical protein